MPTTRPTGALVHSMLIVIVSATMLLLPAVSASPSAMAAPAPAVSQAAGPATTFGDPSLHAELPCFRETGFCITNPAFQEYFTRRGGPRILGFPVSREFTLEGFEVQIFQRVVLQLGTSGVERLNILDPSVMPMTRANQSVFPSPDASLGAATPQVGGPSYARDVVDFVRSVAPDTWNGQPVGFFSLFSSTVPVAAQDPDAATLLNLEIWGVPTSRPTPDPRNPGFIYQRFQRGIMHFRAECRCTEGILVGDYFKSVITARELPPDLAADMERSRFYGQYDPTAPGRVSRPRELASTNMIDAFEPDLGRPQPVASAPTAPPAAASAAAAPAAAASAPGAPGPGTAAQAGLSQGLRAPGAAMAGVPGVGVPVTGAIGQGPSTGGAAPAPGGAAPAPPAATSSPAPQVTGTPDPPPPQVTATSGPVPPVTATPPVTPTPPIATPTSPVATPTAPVATPTPRASATPVAPVVPTITPSRGPATPFPSEPTPKGTVKPIPTGAVW